MGRELRLQERALALNLFDDTSVWSLAFRRDTVSTAPEVRALADALESGAEVVTTGLVLQQILQRFSSIALIPPDRDDHVEAAGLRNLCRRAGVQVGTIDAILAQLCIRHRLTLLATDADFHRIAKRAPLALWMA